MQTGSYDAGDVIGGRYQVLRALGVGGFGCVYEAQALDRPLRVALKVMHERLNTQGVAAQRFQREVALVRRLRHPGVVEAVDGGVTDTGAPFIAFELLEGRTLREELDARGTLGPWHAVRVTRQVLEALVHAHELGVVHRDLKPANIFLCREGPSGDPVVKVLDFGVARSLESNADTPTLTATGQMIGTPHYMSPEQVRGLPADHRADIYTLGVVFAEMLSGVKLLNADSEIELLMIHADDAPLRLPPVVQVTPLRRVIDRAVQKRPEARYPDARQMLADLDLAAGQLAQSGASAGPSWTMSTHRTAVRDGPLAMGPGLAQSVPPPPDHAALVRPSPPPSRGFSRWMWVVGGAGVMALLSLVVVAVVVGVYQAGGMGAPVGAGEGTERLHQAVVRELRDKLRDEGFLITNDTQAGSSSKMAVTLIVAERGEAHVVSLQIITLANRADVQSTAESYNDGATGGTVATYGRSILLVGASVPARPLILRLAPDAQLLPAR
jgi:serine/threonine protein kinase